MSATTSYWCDHDSCEVGFIINGHPHPEVAKAALTGRGWIITPPPPGPDVVYVVEHYCPDHAAEAPTHARVVTD